MRVERIGDATLYLADCYEILADLPDVDAVVTDPPYGINFAGQPTTGQRKAGAAPRDWDKSIISIDPIIRAAQTLAIWGGNYYALPPSRGWLSWYKPDAPPSMSHFELCWTNRDQTARQIQHSISATNAERVGHPTQKPVRVMTWTIQQVGDPSSVVDPFMGSGTTGVACAQLGKRFVGVEVDPGYFAIACERIAAAYAQGRLFA